MKYKALRILATVYKILAWVTLIVGSLTSLSLLFSSGVISRGLGVSIPIGAGIVAALVTVGFTLLQFVFLLGFGELISLIFDIEANTRVEPRVKAEEEEERKMAA